MASVLIMRELSDAVNDALTRYKNQHGLRSNTDAAEGMIINYFGIEDERNRVRKLHIAVSDELLKIKAAYQRHLQAQDDFQRIIQGQETKAEEQKRKEREALEQRQLELIRDRDRVLQSVRNRSHQEEE